MAYNGHERPFPTWFPYLIVALAIMIGGMYYIVA
jgi:hypothetical protein